MNYDDQDFLDPEARALEARLGALVPKAPSDELGDRIFASMEAGFDELDGIDDSAPVARRAWWVNSLVPVASAAAVALFVAFSPSNHTGGNGGAVNVADAAATTGSPSQPAVANVPALPHGMLTRASLDQEVVDQNHEFVTTGDDRTVYRKVSQHLMEKVRLYDKESGTEIVVEVPCEEIRLEKVDLH